MKKNIFIFIRVFVSISLIIILIYSMRDTFPKLGQALRSADRPKFALALLIYVAALLVGALRLKWIVAAQETPVSYHYAVSLTFIGYFFNNFLPTSIGGDVVKAYYLSKKTGQAMGSFASVFVDRAIGLVTMIFMAFIAMFIVGYQHVDDAVKYLIYVITVIAVMAVAFMANKKIARRLSFMLFFLRPLKEKFKMLYDVVHKYRHHRGLLYQSLAVSVIGQILFFLSLGAVALSIGSFINMRDIFLRVPIICALSLLPSINGLGVREGSTVVFFSPLIGKENAFAVSILWLLILLIVSVIGGLLYGLSPQFRFKFKDLQSIRQVDERPAP